MILNSSADLAALKGTGAYADALRCVLGSTTMWVNDAPADQASLWRQVSVGDTLARLDLTIEDLLAECAAAGIVPTAPSAPASVAPLLAPEPVSQPPRIVAAAMGISIAGGDVAAMPGAFNITAALYLGVGTIMLVYLNQIPELSFVSGNAGAASVTAIELTYA